MKILILGGTSDARKIAGTLIKRQVNVVYSVAGLVALPELDCQVISGGFSQYQRSDNRSGLDTYLLDNAIDLVLDATHPYALKITEQAQLSCERLNLKYFRFNRLPWQAQAGDNWQRVYSWSPLLNACAQFKRPMLTTGQMEQQHLDIIASTSEQVVYRTAATSKANLAANVSWLKARGPFDYDAELALLKQLKIDVLISKNAGGKATYAKLLAARDLNIPVIMLDRSELKIDTRHGLTTNKKQVAFGEIYSAVDELLAALDVLFDKTPI